VKYEVALHMEALVADIADEWFLSSVDALVLLPVALVAECLGAHAAGVGLLAVVLPLVLHEVGGTVEALGADGAHMSSGIQNTALNNDFHSFYADLEPGLN
jgi:hypothetical protein